MARITFVYIAVQFMQHRRQQTSQLTSWAMNIINTCTFPLEVPPTTYTHVHAHTNTLLVYRPPPSLCRVE